MKTTFGTFNSLVLPEITNHHTTKPWSWAKLSKDLKSAADAMERVKEVCKIINEQADKNGGIAF